MKFSIISLKNFNDSILSLLSKRGEKEFENVRYDENCCYNSIVRIIYFLWEVAWLFKRMFRSKKIHNKIIVFFSWTQFFCWISSTSSKCTRSMVQWLIWPANHRQYLTSQNLSHSGQSSLEKVQAGKSMIQKLVFFWKKKRSPHKILITGVLSFFTSFCSIQSIYLDRFV